MVNFFLLFFKDLEKKTGAGGKKKVSAYCIGAYFLLVDVDCETWFVHKFEHNTMAMLLQKLFPFITCLHICFVFIFWHEKYVFCLFVFSTGS